MNVSQSTRAAPLLALLMIAAAASAAPLATAADRQPGLSVRFYELERSLGRLATLVPGQKPNVWKIVRTLDLRGDNDGFAPLQAPLATEVDGFLIIKTAGEYTFRLISDDGSVLWLDGALVIDNDGSHPPTPVDGKRVLSAGEYLLHISHFDGGGDRQLTLMWRTPDAEPDSDFVLIPPEVLACESTIRRETAEGRKQIIPPPPRGRSGDRAPITTPYPGFALTNITPPGWTGSISGLTVLPDGRLAVSTGGKDGAVYAIAGWEGDGPTTAAKLVDGLNGVTGLCVSDGVLYATCGTSLVRLEPAGEGHPWRSQTICANIPGRTDDTRCYAGLIADESRFFTATSGTTMFNVPDAVAANAGVGTVFAIGRDGEKEVVCVGLCTPSAIGFGPDGAVLVGDKLFPYIGASRIVLAAKGRDYGFGTVGGAKAAPPVAWLPNRECGITPSAILPVPAPTLAGQVFVGDESYPGIQRICFDRVDGQLQGCVIRAFGGLSGGVKRLAWTNKPALIAGEVTPSWGDEGGRREFHPLEKLTVSAGGLAFTIVAVRARANGFEVELTQPLAANLGTNADWYRVEQWRYDIDDITDERAAERYKSDPTGKRDREILPVRAAIVSPDRTRVSLVVDGLKPGRVVYLRLGGPLESGDGHALWTTEAWYTLNAIPADKRIDAPPAVAAPLNALSDEERAAGWTLLFDGKTTDGWRNFKQPGINPGWKVIDGALTMERGGGDIVTAGEYDDFELSLEWRICDGGNSGIFFRVAEDPALNNVWETGPEMQVLDNAYHADGANPKTSAGSCYALMPPPKDLTVPVGGWNHARIRAQGPHVEFWLNGVNSADFDTSTSEWKELIAKSKFAAMSRFAKEKRGHLALQDHGDRVSYRNIKIRPLP